MSVELLNQAILFKINNPPSVDIIYEDLEEDEEDDYLFNSRLNLSFKLPIKTKNERNMVLLLCFEIDIMSGYTRHCDMILPNYYHNLMEQWVLYYRIKMNQVQLCNKTTKRFLNMIKGFENKSYAYDVFVC